MSGGGGVGEGWGSQVFWYWGGELLPQERCGRHLPPGRSSQVFERICTLLLVYTGWLLSRINTGQSSVHRAGQRFTRKIASVVKTGAQRNRAGSPISSPLIQNFSSRAMRWSAARWEGRGVGLAATDAGQQAPAPLQAPQAGWLSSERLRDPGGNGAQ